MNTQVTPPTNQPDRILRRPDLRSIDGLSGTTRWRLIRAGQYPQPIRLSERTVGWRQSDVATWVANRTTR
ncbi:MAG: helix-turn-helix transcriptional regulator [Vicinamibacterales bacterium]